MYNASKDFNKEYNAYIGEALKPYGFRKYKTGNLLRITSDRVLQCINIQKSAGFEFYINLTVLPITMVLTDFSGETGIRAQQLQPVFQYDHNTTRFSYATKFLAIKSFKEILSFLESKVIPWFDFLSNLKAILRYEKSDAIKNHKFLKPLFRDEFSVPYGYLLLATENFTEARSYFSRILQKANENPKHYLNRNREEIAWILNQLQKESYKAIADRLDHHYNETLSNLSLEKFKLIESEISELAGLLERLSKPFTKPKLPGYGGLEFYHTVLVANKESFESLRTLLEEELDVKTISFQPDHFLIKNNEECFFHFALNEFDFVKEEAKEITAWYGTKENHGKDLKEIENSNARIEIWCDYFDHREYYYEKTRDQLVNLLTEKFTNSLFIPGRWKFYA